MKPDVVKKYVASLVTFVVLMYARTIAPALADVDGKGGSSSSAASTAAADPAPATDAAVAADTAYDYLLNAQAPKVTLAVANTGGHQCFTKLESIKDEMRAKNQTALDSVEEKQWLALFDGCRNGAIDFTDSGWFDLDFGQWLYLGSYSGNHPKLHQLAMQWLERAVQDAFKKKEGWITLDGCLYIRDIAAKSEFHCYDSTIAWAREAMKAADAAPQTHTESTYTTTVDNGEREREQEQEQQQEMMQQQQERDAQDQEDRNNAYAEQQREAQEQEQQREDEERAQQAEQEQEEQQQMEEQQQESQSQE